MFLTVPDSDSSRIIAKSENLSQTEINKMNDFLKKFFARKRPSFDKVTDIVSSPEFVRLVLATASRIGLNIGVEKLISILKKHYGGNPFKSEKE